MTSASVLLQLAAENVRGPEFGKATPMGLAVILILLAATFLLIRSMNRHMKNLPESFDDPEDKDTEAADGAGAPDSEGDRGEDDGDGGRGEGRRAG